MNRADRRLSLVPTLVLVGLAALAAGRCGRMSQQTSTLRIAAASDLRFTLDALLPTFRNAHPHSAVSAAYGSSGTFFAQILTGAPYDVFLSADIDYPRRLVERGLVEPDDVFPYAIGRLALWLPARSTLDERAHGLRVLIDPAVARVAVANPEHAPYGRAALAALESAGIAQAVREKLVIGENVSQTLQFVESGAAQAGLVALSLALAPAAQSAGRYWTIPPDSHPPIVQGGAVLRGATDRAAAEAFRAFLTGTEAERVLSRYGYSPPQAE